MTGPRLNQTLKVEQKGVSFVPSVAQIAVLELTQKEFADVLRQLMSDIETGAFQRTKGKGDYFRTPDFKRRTEAVAQASSAHSEPEFAIHGDLSVEATVGNVRKEIAQVLESLKKKDPDLFAQVFTKGVLRAFDFALDAKKRMVEHLAKLQATYIVFAPGNKFLLQPQTQEDIAEAFHVSSSTISRLARSLFVSFPDRSVHSVDSLIPGPQLERIKGEYALAQIKSDPNFFDPERGWKKSGREIADEIYRRFSFNYAERTINKYIEGTGDMRILGSQKPKIIEEVDALIAQYMERSDLFDAKKQTWKLRPTEVRRTIYNETGYLLPKLWIEELKFENCKIQDPNTLWKRVVRPKRV